MAVRPDGVVFAWGSNSSSQLGDGTTTMRLLPVTTGGITGVATVSAGQGYTLARLADGQVMGWGSNHLGQLGDGTTVYPRAWPVLTQGISTAVAIDAGESHALAVLADGTVRSWGYNSSGQVGDGTTTNRPTPIAPAGLSGITGVAAGSAFSLAVATDGTAWSWGSNGNGQLGTGNTTPRTSPGTVPGLTSVVSVAAGSYTSYAVLSDGTVRAWGYNAAGQLGDGTKTQRFAPVTVTGLTDVVTVSAGESHALALKSDGTVWSWGSNGNGQLGGGSSADRVTATQVAGLPLIAAIGAGNQHSLAVAIDGSVWAWGWNIYGQIGNASQTNQQTPLQIAASGMGWQLPAPAFSVAGGLYSTSQTVTVTNNDASATMRYTTTGAEPTTSDATVASGGTVAVDQSLTLKVKAWRGGYVASTTTTAPYELKVVTPVVTPAPGAYGAAQNVGMTTTTPGATVRFTLDGTEPIDSSPIFGAAVNVATTATVKARATRAGWTPSDSVAHSYWITTGTVATPTLTPAPGPFATAPLVTLTTATPGATIRYSLDGTDPTSASPRYHYPFVVSATTTVKARAFKAGMTESALATGSYAVDAAGAAATPTIVPAGGVFTTQQAVTITGPSGATLHYSTTGVDPTTSDAEVPAGSVILVDRAQVVKVRAWITGLDPSAVRRADFVITGAVAAGRDHSLVLKGDGTVWAWGWNNIGQVGNGTIVEQPNPVQVLSGAVAIAAGREHSLALKADGTVWGWGTSIKGQLGNGATTVRTTPYQAAGLTSVVAIAAGEEHSLALKSDGTVWAFGANADGQLGDGTTTQRLSPVQVVGLTGVVAITAGSGFSAAVQSNSAADGMTWAWGRNSAGQLGDGSLLPRLTPVQVPGGSPATGVAAGWDMLMVHRADASLAATGLNDNGQLGVGATANASTLQPLTVLPGVRHLAAGRAHVLAQDAMGRVWAWGSNGEKRLGAGDSIGPSQPFAVSPYPTLFPAALGLAAGGEHTLIVTVDGKVMGAGSNANARVTTGTASAPIAVPAFAGALEVAANAWLTEDPDHDSLMTWREYLLGTDPLNADTNGNGITDGVEASHGTSDAANPDTDGDGAPNWVEIAHGTDPFNPDSDGDGTDDGADAFPLDPTRSEPPAPTLGDVTPPVITLTFPIGARPVP